MMQRDFLSSREIISWKPALRRDVSASDETSPDTRGLASEASRTTGGIGSALCAEPDLREFCCRLLGWSDERAGLVDEVTRTVLDATARGHAIALSGESDLVPIAYALHRRLLGPERPFVVCDPRRCEGDGSVRAPPSRKTGLLALEAAVGGSVCIRSNRLPEDFNLLAMSLQEPGAAAMLLVCLRHEDRITEVLSRPVKIPSLAKRASDLDRLLNAYLDDAAQALGVHKVRLPARMKRSVFDRAASLSDLEKTALRLVALKTAPSLGRAARQLHMAPVSLFRWIGRRGWTVASLQETEDRRDRTSDR